MAYTTIDDPGIYFNTSAVWSGNAGTQTISGIGFQPNFTWIKNTNSTATHYLFDTVRGATKYIITSETNPEATSATSLTSWNTDGFVSGSNNNLNGSGRTYVSWNWKAGTSFTNDASGTGIGSVDSTGSINTTAGISIMSWTATGSAHTIAHGLGSTPAVIILKNRDVAKDWLVYHHKMSSPPETDYLNLNTTAAVGDHTVWNDTAPTSSVFSFGTWSGNASGNKIVAYCFAEKQGYSKFSSFVGNGNADGTFVYTGFKPAFVITKASSSAGLSWSMHDNKRLGYNGGDRNVYANSANGENTDNALDLLSNGFKSRSADGSTNSSGVTYIYMAFAENPFVTSSGVPACAR